MQSLLSGKPLTFVQMPGFLWEKLFLVMNLLLPREAVQGCEKGWFGTDCKLKCHCGPGVACLSDGQCSGGRPCEPGFFGPGCQFENLAYQRAAPGTPGYLIDGNETTCNRDLHATSVSVTLTVSLPVSWFRIHTNTFAHLLDFTVTINNETTYKNEKRYIQSSHDVDVIFGGRVMLKDLSLEGGIAPTVCSIYISGGRNMALKQFTNQTSTFSNTTNSCQAVDGDDGNEASGSSCAQTKVDNPPKWAVYFDVPQVVTRITVVNSATKEVMRGFSLRALNANGSLISGYTEASENPQAYYDIVLLSGVPTSRLELVGAVRNIRSLQYLHFCEFKAFGDITCPRGTFGLQCQQHCTCNTTEDCHPATGVCAHTCLPGKFGFTCASTCSSACYKKLCSPDSGVCYRCAPGLTGHHCDVACQRGTHGLDCASPCHENCRNDCNATTGHCTHCVEGYFGQNCSQSCPKGCSDLRCHMDTGHCVACSVKHHGPSCEIYDMKIKSNRSPLWLMIPSAAVLILLLGMLCCMCKHCRKSTKDAEDESCPSDTETASRLVYNEPV